MARYHHIFERLIVKAKAKAAAKVAVVYPLSEVAPAGPSEAAAEGLIVPILFGPKTEIVTQAKACQIDLAFTRIIDIAEDRAAAAEGVRLCRANQADALMKGSLHTDLLMQALVHRRKERNG